jgi:uncharacterized protein (DUF433 family)
MLGGRTTPSSAAGLFVMMASVLFVLERLDLRPRNRSHKEDSCGVNEMKQLTRITLDPAVMGGKACIRGLRVTVGTVLGLLASGRTREEILKAYPYLEPEDIGEALAYAAWRVEEHEVPLAVA